MIEFATKPLLMGILNVTPDSFSDGGRYEDTDTALKHAERLLEDGADIIDIGGESTRPYSLSVSSGAQIHRILPVIRAIRQQISSTVPLSIDTRLASVARLALSEGANLINDVSAGLFDPEILNIAAAAQCPLVLMHMQGTPQTMQDNPEYHDVINEVIFHLKERAAVAQLAGVLPKNIILDPGIGFGKRADHDLSLIKHLDQLCQLGYPVLLGASRKSFMQPFARSQNEENMDILTAASTSIAVKAGAKIIRVHNVRASRQALDLAWAIQQAD